MYAFPKSLINSTKNGIEKNFASQWLSTSPNIMINLKSYVKMPFFNIFIILHLGKGSGGIKGGMGAFPPPSQRLCPPLSPVRKKKWPKSAIFGKFLDFCPLRITFCPLMPPQKKNSGAATGQGSYADH